MMKRPMAVAAAALVVLTACEQSNDPMGVAPEFAPSFVTVPNVAAGQVVVCKDAPSGNFNFTLSGISNFATVVSNPFQLAANNCVLTGTTALGLGTLTVTEAPAAGFAQQKVEIWRFMSNLNNQSGPPSLVATSTTLPLSASITPNNDQGFVLVFYNLEEPPPPDEGCTLTQGYWKNHPDAWPVTSLTLGSVVYDQAQLLSIFKQPVKGNGLVSLAHQLIAAKLNIAAGANPNAVSSAISNADALIGGLVVPPIGSGYLAPNSVSSLVSSLDNYNNGFTGPGHCSD